MPVASQGGTSSSIAVDIGVVVVCSSRLVSVVEPSVKLVFCVYGSPSVGAGLRVPSCGSPVAGAPVAGAPRHQRVGFVAEIRDERPFGQVERLQVPSNVAVM